MDSKILCIETASEICSVALISGNEMVMYKEVNEVNAHSRYLTVLIEQVLNESNIKASQLSAVALSKGPGSYTGLRIGASVAKGICYAVDVPLIAIDTLTILARGLDKGDVNENDLIIPMLDARRMEVYYSVLDAGYNTLRPSEPAILEEKSFEDELKGSVVHFIGNGADKFMDICKNPNAVFHSEGPKLNAKGMIEPALNAFNMGQFEDHVYFEPAYLKPVMASKPKKKWF